MKKTEKISENDVFVEMFTQISRDEDNLEKAKQKLNNNNYMITLNNEINYPNSYAKFIDESKEADSRQKTNHNNINIQYNEGIKNFKALSF